MASQPTTGFDFNRPTIVSLLYLVGIVTALPTIIAVVLAYVWRGERGNAAWEDSHYRYHIRTFWIGLLYGLIGFLTTLLGVGFLILMFVPIWMAVRSVVALAAAQRHEPVARPESWLW